MFNRFATEDGDHPRYHLDSLQPHSYSLTGHDNLICPSTITGAPVAAY